MDFIPKDRFLELHPDTLYQVRKEINMERPGEMKRAVNLLKEWLLKQPHLIKKDFPDFYLETTIVGTKGSVERAKKQFDKVCTMRSLMPQFFDTYDVGKDLAPYLENSIYLAMLPKLTKEHYRVFATKIIDVFGDSATYTKYFKFCIQMAEYAKNHDYVGSFRMVVDLSECNLLDYISKINLLEIRQVMALFMDGYGMKIKGIHFISQSRAIDALLTIFKQVLKPKIAGRMHVHKTSVELLDIIDKDVLPVDFGGNERSMKDLFEEWVEILSTEEHKEYIKHINSAGTDESLRAENKFNEEYAGMPGTFRLLTVD
ncbi:retinaldehyde-binding protein 1-like [Zerene cesonia]|uniref:retinaldehyde-binding protein 1-like n=1 Tax=Zerene cesonia TaxID=33412 RepID=UPI0018E59854|nr:retinaldehyde-binding protein 1-like [Zerene cesonia]